MADENKGTGDGSVPHVTPLQFWSGIITVLASTLFLPAWQMYLMSQHETSRQQDVQKVLVNQAETHDELAAVKTEQTAAASKVETAVLKTEEIHDKVNKIAGSLPFTNASDSSK